MTTKKNPANKITDKVYDTSSCGDMNKEMQGKNLQVKYVNLHLDIKKKPICKMHSG